MKTKIKMHLGYSVDNTFVIKFVPLKEGTSKDDLIAEGKELARFLYDNISGWSMDSFEKELERLNETYYTRD